MNEKPILFNSEMVQAILSGRKTQTRRIIKLPLIDKNMGCELAGNELAGEVNAGDYRNCPLGKPGDQLWVRECFSDLEDFDFFNPSVPDVISDYWYWADGNPEWGNWTKPKPSIHMPRRASRINLLITGVRVERLNDISDADALAEGVDADYLAESQDHYDCIADHNMTGRPTAKGYFSSLWQSIYGEESWEANPWVWVIEFERMEAK
ncbi:morphogenetic protein [Yersinia sp. 1652 StPb PI]|uniref:morphogenetic protein n=1 Tax=Yersinia sp. 1652 StPb PI TaxID=3061649 RepID=UPI00355AE68A